MLERLQKPFLTVETGEAYQPIRLTYAITNKEKLIKILNSIKCLETNAQGSWQWIWREECNDIPFESSDFFQRNQDNPLRLGSLSVRENKLFLSLSSFKRACLAVPFFHQMISSTVAQVHHADFLNKVYALDERLPHGLTDLFKEDELQTILDQRLQEFERATEECGQAKNMDEAIAILTQYVNRESHKKLPFAERYEFELQEGGDSDLIFLSFYIFLRGRELVAIRRWLGDTGYTLADATDETVGKVFGSVGMDIIE